jgi:O-antigen/teichoic acid export membrane protein
MRTLIEAFRAPDPNEPDTASRSRERYRRALLTGATSAAARAVSILTILISVPVTLSYLGVERFSVWMTITSLTALLGFADFGLGNGLMNAVARCYAADDTDGLRSYVSTALLTLCAVALFIVVVALCISPSVPWGHLLAVNPQNLSAKELERAMVVFAICLALAIPAAIVQKVQFGLQLGYMASVWQLAASAAALLALLVSVALHASLAWLVAAWLATPSLVLAISAVVFWGYQRPAYRPAVSLARRAHARELARSGGLFFVIQFAGVVAFASDMLIIAHVLGAGAVAQYSVVSKLMDGLVMVSALFLTPLWPAYTDAYARGDTPWIKRTLVASLSATAIVTAAMSLILVALGGPITLAWVGPDIPYSAALFAACAVWAIIKASGNALAMFLNGVGWIGFQAIVAVIFAGLAIVTRIVFARELGIIGVPVALALSYLVIVAIPYAWRVPRIFAQVRP